MNRPPAVLPAILVAVALLATAATPPPPTPQFTGDGVRLGARGPLVRFGTPRAAALARLAGVLGKPSTTRTIPDCGQGEPMTEVTYRGGVLLTFFRGRFSGWDIDDHGKLRTDRGLANAVDRAALKRIYPSATIDEGTLGVMFETDEGIQGFLDADTPSGRVIGIFAGETCKVG